MRVSGSPGGTAAGQLPSYVVSIWAMLESSFLDGKVRKWSLPVVEGATGDYTLKRLLLPQGELARIYDADEGIRFIAFIELRAGTTRGNHFHKVKEEFVYVIQGALTLILEDIASKARDTASLETGDLAFIPTGIAHALRPTRPGQAIEFSPVRFNPEDSYRFPLG